MKTIVAITLAAASLGAARAPIPETKNAERLLLAQNTVCFFKRDETSGMNKICYYDCLGSLTAITISAVAICPLSIKR